LFIQDLGNIPFEISVIPIKKENYISVSKQIKCLSGNSFVIPSSLGTLASNLVDDQLNTVNHFSVINLNFDLCERKIYFPMNIYIPLIDSRNLPFPQGKNSIVI